MFTNSVMGRPLKNRDIKNAAETLGVSDAHVRAVIAVEARGSGFLGIYENDPRLPKILFEAHIFSRETDRLFDHSNPSLSSKTWNQDLYIGGLKEHDRLREAAKLDFVAAHRSASWGMFQIMGFNHKIAGYSNVLDFVGTQYISEGFQLQAGVQFILSKELHKPLSQNDWSAFARGYNGKSFRENRYDEKLASAFFRFSQEKNLEPTNSIKEIQQALNRNGSSLTVDGVKGPRTEAALREFQKRAGLTVDGLVGPKTLKALGLN
jgi:hypothetical protein